MSVKPIEKTLRMTMLCAAIFAAPAMAAGDDGQRLYALNCSGCHGVDGSGMPPQIPDLRISMPALLTSAAGRSYALRVPGVAMSIASQDQVLAILNWMLPALIPQGAGFAAFTSDEIRVARQRPLTDPQTLRRQFIDDAYGSPAIAGSPTAGAP